MLRELGTGHVVVGSAAAVDALTVWRDVLHLHCRNTMRIRMGPDVPPIDDHMVSFYCVGPDGVQVEFGRGGLRIEGLQPPTTYEITKVSFWGRRAPAARV